MTLADYLVRMDITPAEFGRQINASRSAAIRYRDGDRLPRPERMAAIEKATGGKVTMADMIAAKLRADEKAAARARATKAAANEDVDQAA